MGYSSGRLRSAGIWLRAGAAAALAFSLFASAGCGSESHAAEGPAIDLNKLDTGSYQTKPQDFVPKDPARAARTTEALRLGDIMPLPMEIDPALTHNDDGPHPFTGAEEAAIPALPGGNSFLNGLNYTDFTANTAGFVAGFATAAGSDADYGAAYHLTDAVMIFDSDHAAVSAAKALATSGFYQNPAQPNARDATAVQSTIHPNAEVRWIPNEQFLASWYPVGTFVVLTIVSNSENRRLEQSDLPGLLALSDKAIDVTTEKLTSFRPTRVDELGSLPIDRDGMLRLTLPRPPGDTTADTFDGTLDRHGALQTTNSDPATMAALYDKNGVDAVSYGAGLLVRTRDGAAQSYLDAAYGSRFERRIDSPPGLPNARCTKYHGPSAHAFPFACQVAHGRYVASVWSQQQQDVYQRIAAQYAILANDK
ncbi:hypothetical protein GPX89_17000 [Nocardia sp. ET3-3]|uniref:Lipoprotein n=1 Tax=Nocardia terrae TaxID=2675851 RepID=A0A7K1UXH7_9NOCA|nr:hypothetical protein [Nocardia terrae]MVU78937.1 hypothetical protein [Nocardia terrae]